MNAGEEDIQSERHSLNRWHAMGRGLDRATTDFLVSLQGEERAKQARLQALAASTNLPIYGHCALAVECIDGIGAHCRAIESQPGWGVAVKVTDAMGLATFRRLGASAAEVVAAARASSPGSTISLTPYREPDVSGTLWKRDDQLIVELVAGPHFWISKRTPQGVPVVIARASPVRPFLLLDPAGPAADEARLRRIALQAIRHVFGRGLAAVLDFESKAYAEFHWFKAGGMRFIECSFAHGWTGCRP